MNRDNLNKRIRIVMLIILGLVLSSNVTVMAQVEGEEEAVESLKDKKQLKTAEYAPGELIVKLKDGKRIEDIQELNNKYAVNSTKELFLKTAAPEQVLKELKDKLANIGTKHENWYWQMDKDSQEYKDYQVKIEQEKEELRKQIQAKEELIAHLAQRQERTPKGIETPKLDNIYVLTASQNTDISTMAKEYSANPNVEYAEPNYIVKIQMIPNDPYYSSKGSWGQDYDDLWGIKKIEADKAWGISQGEGVVVAVVDSGIDYNHEDIADNIWINKSEIPNNGKDDDHNGYVDDVRGYSFVNNNNDPMDVSGHGTHCAGTIAAGRDNNKGVIGVAPKAKIMAIKGIDDQGSGSDSDLANCLKYAADNNADVINNSWGNSGNSQVLEDAVNYTYSKGCVVVVAAGNENSDVNNSTPANIKNVITVAASDHDDKRCDFSNYGTKIDVSAPGNDILSTMDDNSQLAKDRPNSKVGSGYYRLNGTSMACPHVSGVAALVLAKNPRFNAEQVRYALRNSADDVDNSGWDVNSGYGRVNAYKALLLEKASTAIAEFKSSFPIIGLSGKVKMELITKGTLYKLQYAPADIIPYNYTEITSGPINGTELVTFIWDTSFLRDGKYILKLIVIDNDNLINENRIMASLDNKNLYISSPEDYDLFRVGDKISIYGNAKGQGLYSYKLEYAEDTYSENGLQWNLIKQGNPPIDNNILGVWDTGFIGNQEWYQIRLTENGNYGINEKQFEVTGLYFNPRFHPGWPQRISLEKGPAFRLTPVIADIDKDGNKEIIVSYRGQQSKILIFKLDGTLSRAINLLGMDKACSDPSVGDIDNDGFDEIVITASCENKKAAAGASIFSYVFAYKYDGSLIKGFPVKISDGRLVNDEVVLADLNNDSKLELIIRSEQAPYKALQYYIISNQGKLLTNIQIPFRDDSVPEIGTFSGNMPAIGNFDKDKEPEVVLLSYNNRDLITQKAQIDIHVFNLDGTEVKGYPKSLPDKKLWKFYPPCLGDINGDGKLEIILAGDGIYALDKNGDILPGWPVLLESGSFSYPSLADFNGDGKLDIVDSLFFPKEKTYILDYTGKVILDLSKANCWGLPTESIINDVDGDGKLDIIIGFPFSCAFGSIDAYKFDGTKIKEFSEKIHRGNDGAVTFDDIDKDGKLEMIASSIDVGALSGEYKHRASIYIWDIDTKYMPQANGWNTFRHDNQRTGCYSIPDKTPPIGGIKINNAAEYTRSRTVTLALSAEDSGSGVGEMRFSNYNIPETYDQTKIGFLQYLQDTFYSKPQAYAQTKTWTLSSGDGKKTVYVKFKDGVGNWSAPVSASIILDTIPPVITQTPIVSGSGITFTAKVTDAGAGVQDVFLHWRKKVLKWRGWKVKWVWSEWRKERLTLQPDKSYAVILTAKQVEHRDIKYYITAADKLGNPAATPQYQVKR